MPSLRSDRRCADRRWADRRCADRHWVGRQLRAAALLGCVVSASVVIAPSAPASAAAEKPPPVPAGSWTVYHGDPAGSGNARAVRSVNLGARAWTSPNLDGQIYGQPLVLGHLVYVATENNTVYALSAATGAVRWSEHLGQPVPASSLPCGNISPTVGITGTPVIDQARHEIFVVADEYVGGRPEHVLAGLDTTTGRGELTRKVDPPGQDPAAILQRTGLNLTTGKVVFGFGGNFGDCSTYRGRLVAVPEAGGAPAFFTVAAAGDTSKGAIWMGGAAPAVDSRGNVWVSTGNSTITSSGHPYDNSDGTLQLSPSLRLLQHFAPVSWPADNASDIDFSAVPALLASGQVVQAGKSGRVFLLDGARLGGIGGQQAELSAACDDDIDGGVAVSGTTVFLPCVTGITAVRASSSPPRLRLLWKSGTGGGPPVIARWPGLDDGAGRQPVRSRPGHRNDQAPGEHRPPRQPLPDPRFRRRAAAGGLRAERHRVPGAGDRRLARGYPDPATVQVVRLHRSSAAGVPAGDRRRRRARRRWPGDHRGRGLAVRAQAQARPLRQHR